MASDCLLELYDSLGKEGGGGMSSSQHNHWLRLPVLWGKFIFDLLLSFRILRTVFPLLLQTLLQCTEVFGGGKAAMKVLSITLSEVNTL